jgi:hypothetical protein
MGVSLTPDDDDDDEDENGDEHDNEHDWGPDIPESKGNRSKMVLAELKLPGEERNSDHPAVRKDKRLALSFTKRS